MLIFSAHSVIPDVSLIRPKSDPEASVQLETSKDSHYGSMGRTVYLPT